MSIEDGKGDSIIRMTTLWEWAFKACLVLVAPVTAFFMTITGWLVTTVVAHDKSISNLVLRVDYIDRARSVSQNVHVGDQHGAAADRSGRTWLTTTEVASREQKSERTITNYIEQGLIDPPPQRNGKAWMISEDYRILPQASANLGAPPP